MPITTELEASQILLIWGGMWITKGILSDDRTKLTLWSITKEVASFEKMSEEEYDAFQSSAEPADAPSSHYKIQPEFQGRLLWISGAPGLGKSTIGYYLSRNAGYVFYEADCFGSNVNPYIPLDVDLSNLSFALLNQRPLKGVPKERVDARNRGVPEIKKYFRGEEYDLETVKRYYGLLAMDIKREKERMGGNWVVAQALPTRSLRDHMKEVIGPDLLFIVLNMSKEDQNKRIVARHGAEGGMNEFLLKIYDKKLSKDREANSRLSDSG